MQSKKSCFNMALIKKNLSRYWAISLAYFFLFVIILPVRIYVGMNEFFIKDPYSLWVQRVDEIHRTFRNSIEPISAWMICIVAVVAVFSYLYTSRNANMIHSFPITRKQLFISNYASAMLLVTIPLLLVAIITTGVIAMYEPSLCYLPWMWFFVYCGMNLFFMGFASFVAMFSGQILVVPFFYTVLSFLVYVMQLMVQGLVSELNFGVSGSDINFSTPFSPVVYLADHVRYGVPIYDEKLAIQNYEMMGGGIVCIYAVVGVVFTVLAWYAYKKKRLETAADMLTVNWTKPVFRWGVAFCFAVVGSLFISNIFPYRIMAGQQRYMAYLIQMMIYSAVVFLAAQMFIEKSFRVFRKKMLIECGICACACGIFLSAIEFDIFGYEKRIPETSSVKYVGTSDLYTCIWEDDASIEQLRAIHQKILANKKQIEKESYGQDTYNVPIRYILDDGTEVFRYYELAYNFPSEDGDLIGEQILAEYLAIINQPEHIKAGIFANNYEDVKVDSASLDILGDEMDYETIYLENNPEKLAMLYEAVLKDIDEGNLGVSIMPGDESREKDGYRNDLHFDIYAENGLEILSEKYYNINDTTRESARSDFNLNKNCKHTIRALIEMGAIKSEEELTTNAEYDAYWEKFHGEDVEVKESVYYY